MMPILVEDHPHPADIAFLEQRIIEHNYAAVGRDDGRGLAAFIRDDQGRKLPKVEAWKR